MSTASITTAPTTQRGVLAVVSGQMDVSTAPLVRAGLRDALETSAGPMIVDLSGVPFMDSTGLGVLLGVLRRLGELDRPLALVITTRPVARLFALTGMDKVFAIGQSQAEAWKLAEASAARRAA